MCRGSRIDLAPNSLFRSNRWNYSLLARNNSLLCGRQEIVEFARNRNVGSKPSFYGDATPAGGALPPPIRRAATSPTTIAVRLVLCITLSG